MQLDPTTHTYVLENDRYTSVTTLVHMCFQAFDADAILKKMKITPTSKYYGMTKEEIKELEDILVGKNAPLEFSVG